MVYETGLGILGFALHDYFDFPLYVNKDSCHICW